MRGKLASDRTARIAHYLSLAVAAVLLIWIDRSQWFFYDEWDFITGATTGGPGSGLFAPHNEHWSTLPILLYRALLGLVGLRSYIPYILVLIALHLAIAHLLWRWMIRIRCDAWTATGLAGVFLILGAGAQNLTWGFQVGFLGSVALGMLALLLADRDESLLSWVIGVSALLILSVMCSGVGIEMTIVVAVFCWLRRGLRTATAIASAPALAYILWFEIAAHGHLAIAPPTAAEALQIPNFAWQGITGAFDNTVGVTGVGTVLALAVAVFLVRHAGVGPTRDRAAHALAIGAVAFYLITGYGRVAEGLSAATSSRYLYIVVALLLVPVGWGLTALVRHSLAARLAVAAMVVLAGAYSGALLIQQARHAAALKQTDEQRLLAAVQILHGGGPILAGYDSRPDPTIAPQLSLGTLRALDAAGYLPQPGQIDPPNRLSAVLALQVSISSSRVFANAIQPTLVNLTDASLSPTPALPGCDRIESTGDSSRVELLWAAPASIQVTSAVGGTLRLWYAEQANPTLVVGPESMPLAAGQTVYINVATAIGEPTLSLPAGGDLLCDLR